VIRLNLVLLVAVLVSAMYLINTQYQSRRLFTDIHRAEAEARKLEIENDRLQVERRAQATPLRVDKMAREQLQMRVATPAITQYVTYGKASGAAAPALPASAARGAP
jgi:cell division protein FtsL